MSTILDKITQYVLGIDIETKGTSKDAYILSISYCLIDVWTLKVIECFNVAFDPNDPGQAHRTYSNGTMRWWDEADDSDPTKPSLMARNIAWSGTTPWNDGMNSFLKSMVQINRNYDYVIPMRGPDFDAVILEDAVKDFNFKRVLYPRRYDSHRTVERVGKLLPDINEAEYKRVWKKEPNLHESAFDSAIEAYDTARMYFLVACQMELGRARTREICNDLTNPEIEIHLPTLLGIEQ